MLQSPWSEKARWALDHHGVPYRGIVHMPMLFEPVLRIMARDLRTKPTVPMLFDAGRVYRDSLQIARFAEETGKGSPLFPSAQEREILTWNDASDRLLNAARGRLMERLLLNKDALVEAIPPPLSKLGPALAPVAKLGASFIVSKYATRGVPPAASEAAISSVLEQASNALSRGEYLVGDSFTFADIAIASALGMIAPHARQPLGPASREVWCEPALAAAFPKLVEWRDHMIERHR